VIIYPIILFILARLWFPFGLNEGTIDLKKFYFENFRRIFGWSIVLILFALLTNIFVLSYPLVDELPHFIFLLVLLVISVGNLRNELMHKLVVILITIVSIASVIATWERDASIISQ
jgi:peptidoglycan/LPS O-acetylase OafA/YrhL